MNIHHFKQAVIQSYQNHLKGGDLIPSISTEDCEMFLDILDDEYAIDFNRYPGGQVGRDFALFRYNHEDGFIRNKGVYKRDTHLFIAAASRFEQF